MLDSLVTSVKKRIKKANKRAAMAELATYRAKRASSLALSDDSFVSCKSDIRPLHSSDELSIIGDEPDFEFDPKTARWMTRYFLTHPERLQPAAKKRKK